MVNEPLSRLNLSTSQNICYNCNAGNETSAFSLKVWSHWEQVHGHSSISKKLLSVQMPTIYTQMKIVTVNDVNLGRYEKGVLLPNPVTIFIGV